MEFHISVMPQEVIRFLNPKDGQIIVDCTLGGAGHAQALLENVKLQMTNVKVIGIDQDEEALREAEIRLFGHSDIRLVHDNFSNIDKIIDKPVDGFIFDLGVSSHQIDEASRGFSFREDAPLDMRMDKSSQLTADSIINDYSREDLEKIFKEYGEERYARRIARKIQDTRCKIQINSTFQLKEIIEKAIPTWKKRESVARIFQSLRIAVNNELESLKKALAAAASKLNPGGRIVVISYHSLEDRIVKWFFKEQEKNGILKIITKKPVVPGALEIAENSRAKSAKLRCAEKI